MFLEPSIYSDQVTQVIYRRIARTEEKIHSTHKEDHIEDTRDNYPFPEIMLAYKLVCLEVRFNGDDDLFKQPELVCAPKFITLALDQRINDDKITALFF